MTITRRRFVRHAGAAALAGLVLPGTACAQDGEVFTPEQFGAAGDGSTNDSLAFARLAAAVNDAGGGVVRLRPVTYLVGGHDRLSRDPHWSFAPQPLLEITGCTRPLIIEGNGATIRCEPGLLYGTFDRRTGAPTRNSQPFYGPGQAATPYSYMIKVEGCRGPVSIADLELDGNVQRLRIGGPWGDTGHQIPAVGIFLRDNQGDEIVRDVHTHHHGQDGLMVDGLDDVALARRVRRIIENVRSEYNGRQGCSIIGGRGYRFVDCRFAHTGKAGLASGPGAGVDIEAEGKKVNRDLLFERCQFIDNIGVGFLAEAGDNADVTCRNCRFIGTTAWSAWPFAPGMRFDDCTFVGALVKIYGDANPIRAAQFLRCTFLDDPKLSPNGKVYVPGEPHGAIADLNFGQNARFTRCTFRLTHNGLLPWGWRTIYEDCTLSQKATTVSYPKGEYRGHNTVSGKVDMYNTKVTGTLVLNGETFRNHLFGGEPW
jgi:hypothetical protein